MRNNLDYLDCGDDYIDCGDDYLNCGDDYSNDIPVQHPRKDNWFLELFYKIIAFFSRLFK